MTHWERLIVCKYVFSVASSLSLPPTSTTPSLLLITFHFCCATRWWWRACLRCDCALKKRLALGSLLAFKAGSHSLIRSSTICIHSFCSWRGWKLNWEDRQSVVCLFVFLFFTFLRGGRCGVNSLGRMCYEAGSFDVRLLPCVAELCVWTLAGVSTSGIPAFCYTLFVVIMCSSRLWNVVICWVNVGWACLNGSDGGRDSPFPFGVDR